MSKDSHEAEFERMSDDELIKAIEARALPELTMLNVRLVTKPG